MIFKISFTISFAKDIKHKLINDVFEDLYNLNNGPQWSSILNCQSFTRASIEHLGYKFPSAVEVISDCIPTMMYIKQFIA